MEKALRAWYKFMKLLEESTWMALTWISCTWTYPGCQPEPESAQDISNQDAPEPPRNTPTPERCTSKFAQDRPELSQDLTQTKFHVSQTHLNLNLARTHPDLNPTKMHLKLHQLKGLEARSSCVIQLSTSLTIIMWNLNTDRRLTRMG